MKVFLNLFVFTAAVFFLGCSSGKKALQRGNYDRAVYQAINKLRSNSNHKKATATLSKAYKLAVGLHRDNIQRAKINPDPMKWEWMVGDYQAINAMYNEIYRCPACRRIIPRPVKYDGELSEAELKAAENRYELGMSALREKQNRHKAIEAVEHFQMARNFVPRFRDTEDRIEEALFYATLKVVVDPIPSPVKIFDIKHEFFVNKIHEYLHHNQISPYVRFYTPDEAKRERLPFVDHHIRMEFDRFALGNVSSRVYEKELTKDSVELARKDGVPVYGTVKAKIKINEKSITGSGVLDFQVYDQELNKVITQEKFPSEYVWTARWATYNGDERALGEEEKELVGRIAVSIPGPQRMFEEFTAPLYDQVIHKITSYYRNY